ncbi:MAG: hypothetical protein EA406_00405 [Rhodospirillales bacterium]|nr:MAG: hypothetical protein EA406_00405 [Rhodospirillales bacterium]
MKARSVLTGVVLAMGITTAPHYASADDARVDHYKGLPAETLDDAVKNFSEYNRRLEAILDKNELTSDDLDAVHQLSYTLENALEKIREELSALAEILEEVHVASETGEADRVIAEGGAYLSVARKLIE